MSTPRIWATGMLSSPWFSPPNSAILTDQSGMEKPACGSASFISRSITASISPSLPVPLRARARVSLCARAHPHPGQPPHPVSRRRRAAAALRPHPRPVRRAVLRRRGNAKARARHRHLPHSRARPDRHRQMRRQPRSAVGRTLRLRYRRRLERRGDGKPRRPLQHPLQADARADPGHEGAVDAGRSLLSRRDGPFRSGVVVAETAAKTAPADPAGRGERLHAQARRRILRRLDSPPGRRLYGDGRARAAAQIRGRGRQRRGAVGGARQEPRRDPASARRLRSARGLTRRGGMIREELIFVATCDISGHVRVKGFPARELPARLKKGVGWTGSNLMMSPSGPIWDTPFGTAGDLMIVPDPAVEVRVDFGDGSAVEHFFLGDICTTDGAPWECCPRDFLRRAVDALAAEAGLAVMAGFEQEFVYDGIAGRPGDAYALSAFRRQGAFGEVFMAALAAAGVGLDTFLAEYGARQFEVTVAPAPALTAADHAVITREMARAAAFRLGHRVSFSPKPDPEDVGNGVHIHFSLWDKSGRPMTHTPGETMDLAPAAQHFCAGILHHLPAICAVTAPSPVSYLRLVPNRWAPTAIDLVRRERRRGRCRARSPRRSTGSPPAQRRSAGSARPIWRPICASSASRRKRWPGFPQPSCAPAMPRSIEQAMSADLL